MSGLTKVLDAAGDLKVHLLDVGEKKYGDAVLCQFGNVSVMMDGAHPSDDSLIVKQLKKLLHQEPPFEISLLIVTHPHDDHVGCLPRLVANGLIKPAWALVADPQYRWGQSDESDNHLLGLGFRARGLVEALNEENRADLPDAELTEFIDSVATLRERYTEMIENLSQQGTMVVHHETEDARDLKEAFKNIGLNIVGPKLNHLRECRRLLQENEHDALDAADSLFLSDSTVDVASVYRSLLGGAADWFAPNKGAINLQSIVTIFEYNNKKLLFAGDMQFAKPEVQSDLLKNTMREMGQQIQNEAPFDFYKVSHHGSYNAFSEPVFQQLGETTLFGICGGKIDPTHPDEEVLELLDAHREIIQWVRTDHNGQTTILLEPDGSRIEVSRGEINDAEPNTGGVTDAVRVHQPGAAVSLRTDSFAIDENQSRQVKIEVSARVPSNATVVNISVSMDPSK